MEILGLKTITCQFDSLQVNQKKCCYISNCMLEIYVTAKKIMQSTSISTITSPPLGG
ncbi:MAG: hypothetical protein J6P09_03650 [Methanobrevibacter sp.]|nr:hypothetical protein [Methanobrevibacter sp.]